MRRFIHVLPVNQTSNERQEEYHEIKHKRQRRRQDAPMKGKIKEVAGKLVKNRDLEAEGKAENLDGDAQEKIGKIKKFVGK
jgi:uncharacterized protein YjbJ (UPF0337 family)